MNKIQHLRTYNYLVPEGIGAYVITHIYDIMYAVKYIGSSENLYTRMIDHNDKQILYIDFYITNDINLARSLERILIELIKPATNIMTMDLSYDDKELMKEILKDNKLKGYILENIIKKGYRHLKYFDSNEKHKIFREGNIIDKRNIKNIIILGGSPAVTIPKSFGFKKGEHVTVEKLDDNSCKISKIEWNKINQNND